MIIFHLFIAEYLNINEKILSYINKNLYYHNLIRFTIQIQFKFSFERKLIKMFTRQ